MIGVFKKVAAGLLLCSSVLPGADNWRDQGIIYFGARAACPNGEKIRDDWYDTTGCPPKLERMLASLSWLFFWRRPDWLVRHLRVIRE